VTWLKLPDDFADDCARMKLSDAAFRTHIEGLLWTMRRETGGFLDDRDIARAIETVNPTAAIAELTAVGFWQPLGTGGLRIVHAMQHQPEPDLIAKRREASQERVRKYRRKQAGLTNT
jgi:hypothetical protein